MPFKLTLKDFVVQDPFILDLSWTHIRDQIVIDAKLQQKILDESYPGATVRLVARVITHAPGFVLKLPGHDLQLVAGEYDANGGAIDVSADDGPAGHSGPTGSLGYASAGGISRPGGPRRSRTSWRTRDLRAWHPADLRTPAQCAPAGQWRRGR